MKRRLLAVLPLITLVGPVMAIDKSTTMTLTGALKAPSCSVNSPNVDFGSVVSSTLTAGSNEVPFNLAVQCDLDSRISAIQFSGTAVSGKSNVFAVSNSSGVVQTKGDVSVRLRVASNQTTVWGANAVADRQIDPNSNLLGSTPVDLKGKVGDTNLSLKVAMIDGYTSADKVSMTGTALTAPISVSITY